MRRRKPSLTAYGIARAVDFAAGDPRLSGLLPDLCGETGARLMHHAFRRYRLDHWLLRRRWARSLARFQERIFMPGILAHVALRKRFIDDEVRAALGGTDPGGREPCIATGSFSQLLVLGAGFDTLCARLAPLFPQASFFEVDHPPTQARKQRGLEDTGLMRGNIHLVAADFQRDRLPDLLAAHPAWREGEPAVVVAEGLTMYLSEEAVRLLLESFRDRTGPGSCLLFTFMEARGDGRLALGRWERLTNFQLRCVGEPFDWGIARRDLPAFLARHGLSLLAQPDRELLRAGYLAPLGLSDLPLADFEYFAVAGKA